MSERRPADEMTDPGSPPEEALDATLRALGAPVRAQARHTPESAGLEAAHYQAAAHRPPRAHEPSSTDVATTVDVNVTAPMAAAIRPAHETVRAVPKVRRMDGPTVPRAAAAPRRATVFVGALAFVVVVLGIASWAIVRRGPEPSALAAPPSTISASPATASAGPATSAVATGLALAVANTGPSAPAAMTPAPEIFSATVDPSRPTGTTTGRPPPSVGTTVGTSPGRRLPMTTAAAPTPVTSGITAATATASPAPTTKYNHLLKEDKQ